MCEDPRNAGGAHFVCSSRQEQKQRHERNCDARRHSAKKNVYHVSSNAYPSRRFCHSVAKQKTGSKAHINAHIGRTQTWSSRPKTPTFRDGCRGGRWRVCRASSSSSSSRISWHRFPDSTVSNPTHRPGDNNRSTGRGTDIFRALRLFD